MTSKISGKLQNQDISIFSPKNNFVWYTILIEPQEWRSFLIQEHFEIVGHPHQNAAGYIRQGNSFRTLCHTVYCLS